MGKKNKFLQIWSARDGIGHPILRTQMDWCPMAISSGSSWMAQKKDLVLCRLPSEKLRPKHDRKTPRRKLGVSHRKQSQNSIDRFNLGVAKPEGTVSETLQLKGYINYIWLVVSTPLKNVSQLRILFPIYGKTKNVPTTNQIYLSLLI